jgi:hypothetical protein
MAPMLILFRQFLVVFLVLLQLFAPLVHAHVDKHFASAGLHVPGLELHVAGYDSPSLQAAHCAFSANNLMVSINTGITEPHKKNPANAGGGECIQQPVDVFTAAISVVDRHFSPLASVIVSSLFISPYAPRAPPLR